MFPLLPYLHCSSYIEPTCCTSPSLRSRVSLLAVPPLVILVAAAKYKLPSLITHRSSLFHHSLLAPHHSLTVFFDPKEVMYPYLLSCLCSCACACCCSCSLLLSHTTIRPSALLRPVAHCPIPLSPRLVDLTLSRSILAYSSLPRPTPLYPSLPRPYAIHHAVGRQSSSSEHAVRAALIRLRHDAMLRCDGPFLSF